MPDFQHLPPHIRHLPEVVDARLTRLENRQPEVKGQSWQDDIKRPIAIIAAAALAIKDPQMLLKFFGL